MTETDDLTDPFPVGCRVRYEGIWPTGEHPTGTVIRLADVALDDGRRTVQWDDERVSTEEQSWLTRIDSEPDPADPDRERVPWWEAQGRTERVPWWEAQGRTEPAGNVIEQVGTDPSGPYICTIHNGTRLRSLIDHNGHVTVLAEEGAS